MLTFFFFNLIDEFKRLPTNTSVSTHYFGFIHYEIEGYKMRAVSVEVRAYYFDVRSVIR